MKKTFPQGSLEKARLDAYEAALEKNAAESKKLRARLRVLASEKEVLLGQKARLLREKYDDILSRVLEGATYDELAAEWGVTPTRVREVVFGKVRRLERSLRIRRPGGARMLPWLQKNRKELGL